MHWSAGFFFIRVTYAESYWPDKVVSYICAFEAYIQTGPEASSLKLRKTFLLKQIHVQYLFLDKEQNLYRDKVKGIWKLYCTGCIIGEFAMYCRKKTEFGERWTFHECCKLIKSNAVTQRLSSLYFYYVWHFCKRCYMYTYLCSMSISSYHGHGKVHLPR